MPLRVETGTGAPQSDSYASLDDANAYCLDYGLPWSGTDAAKEAALRRATRYIDAKYRSRFLGTRQYRREQGLEWPRLAAYRRVVAHDAQEIYPSAHGAYYATLAQTDYISPNSVPIEVVRATIMVASQDLSSPGVLIPSSSSVSRSVGELRSRKAGDHEETYFQSTPELVQEASEVQSLAIEEALTELLTNESGYTSRAMRA